MAAYKNASGQEPTLDEDASSPDPYLERRNAVPRRMFNRYVEQAGHLPIDPTQCQAPSLNMGPLDKLRCPNKPAVCVMVENKPNSRGRIAGMALCARCRDRMIMSHGAGYAKITPL